MRAGHASTTPSDNQRGECGDGPGLSRQVDKPGNTAIRRVVKGVSVSSDLTRDRSGLPADRISADPGNRRCGFHGIASVSTFDRAGS